MRANRRDERAPVAAGNEAHLQVCAGARRNRVDGPVRIAGAKREHFERVPSEHALGGRQSRLAPVAVDRRPVRLAGLDVRERAPHRCRNRRREQPGHLNPAVRIDHRRNRVGEDDAGIRQEPAPVARMMRALAQVDDEIEIERAARPEEDRRPIGAKARTVGGDQDVGAQRRRTRFADASQPGRADFLAHLEQQLRIEAEPAARRQHLPERREVDRVLALVVGRAAAVPAAAVHRDFPRRTAAGPLAVVAGDDVAVAVDQHRRQRRILAALGEQHRRRAGDGVVPERPAKAHRRNTRADFVGQVAHEVRGSRRDPGSPCGGRRGV